MAKKKVPINEKVKTRKDEIRFKTDDPKRMLNKYICARVLKTWTEDFVDEDTGELLSIEFTVDGDELSITQEGETVVFKKQK